MSFLSIVLLSLTQLLQVHAYVPNFFFWLSTNGGGDDDDDRKIWAWANVSLPPAPSRFLASTLRLKSSSARALPVEKETGGNPAHLS